MESQCVIAGGQEPTSISHLLEWPACLLEASRGSPAPFLRLFSAHLGATFSESNGAWTADEGGQNQVIGETAEGTPAAQPRSEELSSNSAGQSQARGSDLL